jgi:hypothetical protein
MKSLTLLAALFLALPGLSFGQTAPPGNLRLLEGYSIRRTLALDTMNATIEGKSGLRIEFEAGFSEGPLVQPERKATYEWYREQVVDGHQVYLALVGGSANPKMRGKSTCRGRLEVSYPLVEGSKYATANFSAVVRNPQDLADALLMILTFDPDKL